MIAGTAVAVVVLAVAVYALIADRRRDRQIAEIARKLDQALDEELDRIWEELS
jgi:hypothetical protein